MAETKEKDYQLSDLIEDACEEYDEGYDGDINETDTIHEIADNAVPIHYWDIAQYAAWNTWLMTEVPDIGRDCEPYKMIQLNIYEAICEGLYEHVAEKEKENDK